MVSASYVGGLLLAITCYLATGSITFGLVMLAICWAGTSYAAPRVFPFGDSSAIFMVPQIPLGLFCLIGMLYKFVG